MKERRFIGFRIVTLLALGVEAIMILNYFRSQSSLQYKFRFENTSFDFISLAIFLTMILFQFLNFRMADFLTKNNLPNPFFNFSHLFLLVCNSIYLLGIGTMLYGPIFNFFTKHEDFGTPFFFATYPLWFITNIITIISSLRLRKYLRQQYEAKGQYLLESFGKSEI